MTIRAAIFDTQNLLGALLECTLPYVEVFSVSSLFDFSQNQESYGVDVFLLEERSTDSSTLIVWMDYLKTHHPDIPIIVIADSKSSKVATTAILLNAFAVLVRPFKLDDLELVLNGAKAKKTWLKPNQKNDNLECQPHASSVPTNSIWVSPT